MVLLTFQKYFIETEYNWSPTDQWDQIKNEHTRQTGSLEGNKKGQ